MLPQIMPHKCRINAADNAADMLLTVFTRTFYVVNTYHIRKTSCDGNAMVMR